MLLPIRKLSTILRACLFDILPEGGVLVSHSVVSDSLWPHGLQHARLPCLSVSVVIDYLRFKVIKDTH